MAQQKPITQRKKKLPLTKSRVTQSSYLEVPIPFNVWRDDYTEEEHQAHEPAIHNIEIKMQIIPPHHLRKKELAELHGLRESDVFVDPGNGVELFRTSYGTWATSPGY